MPFKANQTAEDMYIHEVLGTFDTGTMPTSALSIACRPEFNDVSRAPTASRPLDNPLQFNM